MWMVVGKDGVDVVRDESRLPKAVQHRIQERRRHRPIWYASQGICAGASLGYLVNLSAQGLSAEWLSPSTIMAVGTMVFACGQMWSARMEDRRRITKLEDQSVTKSAFDDLKDTVGHMDSKLDRLIERD